MVARRSGRLSSTPQKSQTASTNGRSTARKRNQPEEPDSTRKAPKQQKSMQKSRTTPRKSQHFTKQEYDDATGLTSDDTSDVGSDNDESDFGNDDADTMGQDDDTATSPTSDEEDEDDFSADDTPKRKKKRRPPKAAKAQNGKALALREKSNELWREGVTTGLEPGVEVIIKKPKARTAGKTPYTDETIHPNTLLFLLDLKKNNDREWLKMNDPDFRASEKDFKAFIETLTQRLIEIDDTVPELPVKDIVFRIYRDVRFSKDPTPYKPYFSAAWSRTGRKGPYAAYYLQIAPGESFLGGGSWCPESQPLARLRADIDQHPDRLKNVLMDDGLRKEFLRGAPKNAQKVVKAFVGEKLNKESALRTRPQGFDKDHKDIDLLRLKNFTIGCKLKDEEIVSPKFIERLSHLMTIMQPYIHYLNSVVMPDAAAEDEEEDDADRDDDDEEEGSSSGDDDEA